MVGGEPLKVVAPQARLLPLTPACAASVPAVGALTVGEVATLVSLGEPFQGWDLCLGELLMGMVCPNTLFQREWA